MEAESRELDPDVRQNSRSAGGEAVPIGGRKYPTLEVSPEEMEVNDHENGQSFCHIKPEEPLHRRSA